MARRFDPITALHMVREVLEGALEPTMASSVVFEAMAREGVEDLPADEAAFTAFVEGPLEDTLVQRLDPSLAQALSDALSELPERISQPRRASAQQLLTAKMKMPAGPVRVLVLSRGSLAVWLRAALSGDPVEIRSVGDVGTATEVSRAFDPLIGILDGTSPPLQSGSEHLAGWLGTMPADGRVLWGVEKPSSAAVVEIVEREGATCIPIDSCESVEPLLDLIRSRCG